MKMHEVYLPFTEDQLHDHFVPVKGPQGDKLAYYKKSLRHHHHLTQPMIAGAPIPSPSEVKLGQQIEKDERFWIVSALMSLYHAGDGTQRHALFARLMDRAGVTTPAPCSTWDEALHGPLLLYFEVSLPSPPSYKAWLADHPDRALIPHLKTAATGAGLALEGATKADAVLLAPDTGVAAVFEAKVLSDLSTHIRFDLARNQLARIIDVTLDSNKGLLGQLSQRDPQRTYVVMLTPEVLHPRGAYADSHRTRLYGWLLPEYQDPASLLLAHHLPHRTDRELTGVPQRLGWATWEDINRVLPDACPWLA